MTAKSDHQPHRMQLLQSTVGPTYLLKLPRFLFHYLHTLPQTRISTSSTKPLTKTPKLNQNALLNNHHNHSSYCSFSAPIENPKIAFLDLLHISAKNAANLFEVELLHARTIKIGFTGNWQMGNCLLNLYIKWRRLEFARRVFDEIPNRDVRTWTILITGYTQSGLCKIAVDLFSQMKTEGVLPNCYTFASVLKCCGSINDLEMGKEIHGWILRHGILLDIILENSILDCYAKCGGFGYARRVFEMMDERDTVSWNIMIGAYLQSGESEKSIELFRRMPFRDVVSWNTIIAGHMRNGFDRIALELLYQMGEIGPKFNKFTFSIALVVVATLAMLELGRCIHGQVLRIAFESDTFIRNSLIDMYCKCGKMEKALTIFGKMLLGSMNTTNSKIVFHGSTVNNISWSSMIAGYVQNGRDEEALKLFVKMLQEGVEVDIFTLTSIASACASAGLLEQGRQVHAHTEKFGCKSDVVLASAIIHMYSKCGCIDDARVIFDRTHIKNIVLWTSIITGFALHGRGKDAIQLFELMLKEKIKPNEISFVGVLSACSHAGLVKEGHIYFRSMRVHHIVPSTEHFTCMVDLLGRAGLLDEAKSFIYENGISHLSVVWRALLSACRVHNNVDMGKWASENLVRLTPFDAGSYVLLSNICANQQRWAEAANMRSLMRVRGIDKDPGQSWIQLKNKIHIFVVGDRSHPQVTEIYSYLERLIGRMREIGYSADTSPELHDVEEEQKEVLLGFHSEKLAIAYGIISTPCGSPVRVMKNLRVCSDCHTAIKYISRVTGREIMLRDAYRFHHFKDEQCSCGDYW